tara:strand:+ start:20847 stop:21293 length:447 start_codon:yes stop_codon:yes gene_type:complete
MLLEDIISTYKSKTNSKTIVLFIGDANVGKTAIVNRLINSDFDNVYEQTENLNIIHHNDFIYLDFPGEYIYSDFSYKKPDVVVLVYDLKNRQSYKNIEFWKEKVSHTWENEDIPIEIVGNKYDGFFRFVFKDTPLISAKNNTNILHSN